MVFTKTKIQNYLILKLHQATKLAVNCDVNGKVKCKGGNRLTANQIAYVTHLEQSRHNVRVEDETERHNRANVGLGYANLNLGYANLNETRRANMAREGIQRGQLDETIRHNTVQEDLGWQNAANQERLSDIKFSEMLLDQQRVELSKIIEPAKVSETQRHNLATEEIGLQDIKTKLIVGTQNTLSRLAPGFYNLLNPGGK